LIFPQNDPILLSSADTPSQPNFLPQDFEINLNFSQETSDENLICKNKQDPILPPEVPASLLPSSLPQIQNFHSEELNLDVDEMLNQQRDTFMLPNLSLSLSQAFELIATAKMQVIPNIPGTNIAKFNLVWTS
jgi:hypothetical protein